MGMKEGTEPGWCVERRVGNGVSSEGNSKYTPWGRVWNVEHQQGQQDLGVEQRGESDKP